MASYTRKCGLNHVHTSAHTSPTLPSPFIRPAHSLVSIHTSPFTRPAHSHAPPLLCRLHPLGPHTRSRPDGLCRDPRLASELGMVRSRRPVRSQRPACRQDARVGGDQISRICPLGTKAHRLVFTTYLPTTYLPTTHSTTHGSPPSLLGRRRR